MPNVIVDWIIGWLHYAPFHNQSLRKLFLQPFLWWGNSCCYLKVSLLWKKEVYFIINKIVTTLLRKKRIWHMNVIRCLKSKFEYKQKERRKLPFTYHSYAVIHCLSCIREIIHALFTDDRCFPLLMGVDQPHKELSNCYGYTDECIMCPHSKANKL